MNSLPAFIVAFGVLLLLVTMIGSTAVVYGSRKANKYAPASEASAPETTPSVNKVTAHHSAGNSQVPWNSIIKAVPKVLAWTVGLLLIAAIVWTLPQLLKWSGGPDWTWPILWPNWLAMLWFLTDPVFWFIIGLILLFLSIKLRGLSQYVTIGLLLGLIFGVWLYDWTKRTVEETGDRLNNGVLLDPAPAQPLRYTDGMILNLRPGESQTIVLVLAEDESIKVTNYEGGHCMMFAPESQVYRNWNRKKTEANVGLNVVPAGLVREQVVNIRKLKPGERVRPGESKRCPPLN